MTTTAETIDREAHDKVKGFRFQKLRAVSLMLKAMREAESSYIYCAIENIGDLHLHTASTEIVKEYIEEDKDYADKTSFSLNSDQVLNTIVYFIDAWHTFNLSSTLYFGFCTTANIAKENRTKRLIKLNINLPNESLLQLLVDHAPLNDVCLAAIKSIVIAAYKDEYATHDKNGNLDSINKWSDSTWREFFSKITWYIGEKDEIELEKELVEELKQCSFYNYRLDGKEGHVISLLVDEFDKSQNKKNYSDRFVHASAIKLIAKQIESGEYFLPDPAWKMWKDIAPPTDKRNLIDKVHSVAIEFDKNRLDGWCRSVALSRFEQDSLRHDKSIMSLRYRIFESCHDKLLGITKNKQNYSSEELAHCLEDLVRDAEQHIAKLKPDYKYSLSNTQTIHDMILELIDSCFLSFDENGDRN
ncbi:MAG: hypothetical protein ABSA44_11935 [Bacteroidota bacterium]|jgi:hypothetical protein